MDLKLTKRDANLVACALAIDINLLEDRISARHTEWRRRNGEDDWFVPKKDRLGVARLRRHIAALKKIIARIDESQAKGKG